MLKKYIFVLFFLVSSNSANIFVMTDDTGTVIHSKYMQHNENAFLQQKSTEYSLQAIADELNKVQRHARLAALAKERVAHIKQAQKIAKKSGKTYHLSEQDRKNLLEDAKYYKGGKYVWGGTTPQGFDCSGYVQYLYRKHNIELPRTAYAQAQRGTKVTLGNIQKGDLLFFLTDKKRGIPVTHVGIYLGNGNFIHAASKKKGIIISPIHHGFYNDKFVSARRISSKV